MTRIDNYRRALLAAFSDISDEKLLQTMDDSGSNFARLVIDHGLGPLWHERTGRTEFVASRMAAEALFLAQESALQKIDDRLGRANIKYAVIKGTATRLLLYENPAVRACHDIDIIVNNADRVRTAAVLHEIGFSANLDTLNISHQLLLSNHPVVIDLHWGLLREGRLRKDVIPGMLARCIRAGDICMLSAEDALFVLLVHPAFAKHLEAWRMGLHRVVDIMRFLETQDFDWPVVLERLGEGGVRTAAWATLTWVQLLAAPILSMNLSSMLRDTQPGRARQAWLRRWLRNDLSSRTSEARWVRLLGFSAFLHDSPTDVARAMAGRRRAYRRQSADLAAFSSLNAE